MNFEVIENMVQQGHTIVLSDELELDQSQEFMTALNILNLNASI